MRLASAIRPSPVGSCVGDDQVAVDRGRRRLLAPFLEGEARPRVGPPAPDRRAHRQDGIEPDADPLAGGVALPDDEVRRADLEVAAIGARSRVPGDADAVRERAGHGAEPLEQVRARARAAGPQGVAQDDLADLAQDARVGLQGGQPLVGCRRRGLVAGFTDHAADGAGREERVGVARTAPAEDLAQIDIHDQSVRDEGR